MLAQPRAVLRTPPGSSARTATCDGFNPFLNKAWFRNGTTTVQDAWLRAGDPVGVRSAGESAEHRNPAGQPRRLKNAAQPNAAQPNAAQANAAQANAAQANATQANAPQTLILRTGPCK